MGTAVAREPHTDFIVARAANPVGGEMVAPCNDLRYGGTPRWVASSSPIVLCTGCKAAGSIRRCHPEKEDEPIYSAGNGGCK